MSSLHTAGWQPFCFAEPGTDLTGAEAFWQQPKKRGVWLNWLFAAEFACTSGYPFVALVQDDITVHPDTMEIVEWWFSLGRPGPVSLYTSAHYQHISEKMGRPMKTRGIFSLRPEKLWGACGLCYRREELQSMLELPWLDDWIGASQGRMFVERAKNVPSSICNSDVAIGNMCRDLNLPIWFATPSLASHDSVYSTIHGHGDNDAKRGRNCEQRLADDRCAWDQLCQSDGKVEVY